MRPYKTDSVLVERVWGGRKLCEYNKCVIKNNIGESWETGKITKDIPVLIKLIDAKENLSVQVHPDDEFAAKVESAENGKSEAWVILECEEDSFIIYGFKRPAGKEELKRLLEKGMVLEVLNCVKVRKGDCIYIPAGTLHSLGRGILAYEVQQPSDLTYRVYDWNRTDSQGKGRELHIDKAVEAINYSFELPRITNIYDLSKNGFFNIIECRYFESSFGYLKCKEHHGYDAGRFRAVTMVSGFAALKFENYEILVQKGDTCIIPKDYGENVNIEGLKASEYIVTTCNI